MIKMLHGIYRAIFDSDQFSSLIQERRALLKGKLTNYGVSDDDIFVLGDLNGDYPQRHRYGTGPYNTNGANVEQANSVQGPDLQATKLWWAN